MKEIDLADLIKGQDDCLESSMNLRESLKERYPEQRKEINLLVNVYEAGILEKIKGIKVITDVDVNGFAEILEEEYGLEKTNSIWAIKAWAMAYGVCVDGNLIAMKYIKRASGKSLYSSEVKELFRGESVE